MTIIMENKYLQWLSGNTQSIYWHDGAEAKGLRRQLETELQGNYQPFFGRCNAAR